MVLKHLKTNHLENPIGYRLETLRLSWVVAQAKGSRTEKARVCIALDPEITQLVHDSGEQRDLCPLEYAPAFIPAAGTRYYWQVQVWDDAGETGKSPVAFFETAAPILHAQWIEAPFDDSVQPLFRKAFSLPEPPVQARLRICGLGLYEAMLNGEKVGDEYLTPFCNDYNLWLQVQTYDVTAQLHKGDNCLGVLLGNGWYKGRFGFLEHLDRLYGDRCRLLCELSITFADGSRTWVFSDEDWLCAPSPVLESGIYDGEVWDSRREIPGWCEANCDTSAFVSVRLCAEIPEQHLTPRLSLPVKIMERLSPVEILHTPAGETVLDFGQEMTGWVKFYSQEPTGSEVLLQYGEILQNGNFYNENLRTAKAEFRWISRGQPGWIRPHFTFYGFRYVKLCGFTHVDPSDFVGCVMYSEMRTTGRITTSHPKVNRLICNALWGQKGNFLDVPTDCPQRDERMGWTGDAQVFCATASFQMDTPAFFTKYLYDMKLEQQTLDGSVPYVVPDVLGQIDRTLRRQGRTTDNESVLTNNGACAWADAATVIPWTLYQSYGSETLLAEQYPNMKLWVDHVRRIDKERCGDRYLWTEGFHYADWLALDNFHKDSCFGATDPYLVASAYYYYSASLTAKAAQVLRYDADADYYRGLAARIKEAFLAEYYTASGRLAQQTQTSLALVLWLDLIPKDARQRQVDALLENLRQENMHLTTGFVGTPLLCPVLSASGHADIAYTLLLNEDYPGWLYEVNLGATTIWERWNSVLPDGRISDPGMNSLNHYAYGSIVTWMVQDMCGLSPLSPGYRRFAVRPQVDDRLDWTKMSYESASGLIRCEWCKQPGGHLYTVEVPYDTEAEFFPDHNAAIISVNGTQFAPSLCGPLHLTKGVYRIVTRDAI